jgi:PKD repeat protein
MIAEAPPTAAFVVGTSSPTVGQAIAFDSSAPSEPEGTIISYEWSFGDESASGGGATPSHTYVTPGEYTVTLTVTDAEGKTGEVSHMITVAEALPIAAFSVATASPTAGQPIAFDGSASSDPGGTITGYEWSFGDGESASGATPSHTYAKPGGYTVTLKVADDEGKTTEVSHTINVAEAPSPVSSSPTVTQPVSIELTAPISNKASTEPETQPQPKPKPLTNAQKLAKALKACKKYKSKGKRVSCKKAARKKYRPVKKKKKKKKK